VYFDQSPNPALHVIPPRIQVVGWPLALDVLSSFGGGIRELCVRPNYTPYNMNTTICQAIKAKRLVQFSYDGGTRVVEPHMVASNEAGHYALSGWFVRGHSKSGGQGWREYLLSDISSLSVLDETFAGARPGYNPSGGKKFPTVFCRL